MGSVHHLAVPFESQTGPELCWIHFSMDPVRSLYSKQAAYLCEVFHFEFLSVPRQDAREYSKRNLNNFQTADKQRFYIH